MWAVSKYDEASSVVVGVFDSHADAVEYITQQPWEDFEYKIIPREVS